jgi:hypothetical protein
MYIVYININTILKTHSKCYTEIKIEIVFASELSRVSNSTRRPNPIVFTSFFHIDQPQTQTQWLPNLPMGLRERVKSRDGRYSRKL